MSSQSPLQITVYASPEHEHVAVRRALDSFGLATDWGLPSPTLPDQITLRLGERYGTHHAPLGTSDNLASRLRAEAPGTAFLLWQDPYFEEADGHYVARVPDVGDFESPCNANGTPNIDLSELIVILRQTPTLTTEQWLAGPGQSVLGSRVRQVVTDYEHNLVS
ncbi:hypothetical protein [Streptomyces sp. NPDC007088]|uniref:hypothetical protein n=1 Tax=Streptomyces sp. NPDC007088 TaxID=3364773 RepID=UPI0036984BAB